MHFERHFAFQMHKIIFFSRKPEKILGFTSIFGYGQVTLNTGIFGNDVFSKHLFPMVSYTQNTHKIPIPLNPRSTLLPSPLPRPLQPV